MNIKEFMSKIKGKPSHKELLETSISSLSQEDKKELLVDIREMYQQEKKYLLKGGRFTEMETNILTLMSGNIKDREELARLVFLLFIDTLPLEKQMEIERLISDFIRKEDYEEEAFEINFKEIVQDPFLREIYKQTGLICDLRDEIAQKVKNAQANLSEQTIKSLKSHITRTNGLLHKPETKNDILKSLTLPPVSNYYS